MEKINLLILFGGVSSEHEISRLSTASVLTHIDKDKYNISVIGITREGKWLLTDADVDEISRGTWESSVGNREAIVSPDRSTHGLIIQGPEDTWVTKHIDVVFPVMHGQNAEDGTIQGLMQIAGIPCVGPGTAASAVCMDKAVAKAMVSQNGRIKQAGYFISYKNLYDEDKDQEIKDIVTYFENEFPLFVKPANAGSSVGISKVRNPEELAKGLEVAFAVDNKVLVEETIVGRELEVAVLGNDNPEASCIGEIFAANEFYDFNAKYENTSSRTSVVTDLSDELQNKIREMAITIYNIMGCKGLSRVDFFLREDGKVYFNEVNTIPGFTKISMYPQLWENSGMTYSELIDRLVSLAIENKPSM